MPEAQAYEITVKGWLDPRWSDWFEGLTVSNLETGEAILAGPLPDQAALHGVLARIRDLNLTLIAVRPIERQAEFQNSPQGASNE